MEDGKILRKFEFGSCFFCDKVIIVSENHCLTEDYGNLRELFGDMPERLGGKIGNKVICKSCKGDIWALVQEEDF